MTPQTVRNVLRRAGLKAVKKVKKPALNSRHRKRRLEFAREYREWTIENWKKIVWSDETKINRICSDGIQFTWRRDNREKDVVPTLRFGGGNIMIWECISWSGLSAMVRVIGKMNSRLYISI